MLFVWVAFALEKDQVLKSILVEVLVFFEKLRCKQENFCSYGCSPSERLLHELKFEGRFFKSDRRSVFLRINFAKSLAELRR